MDPKLPALKETAADIIYQSEKARLISTEERQHRMTLVDQATSLGELEKLITDLRPSDAPTSSEPSYAPVSGLIQNVNTIMGSSVREGEWLEGNRVKTVTVMGETRLSLADEDLTRARFGPEGLLIQVTVVMGELTIRVPENVVIKNEISSIMAEVKVNKSFRQKDDRTSPRITLIGNAIMGEVKIRGL